MSRRVRAWALAAIATLSVVATVAGQLLFPAASFDASAAAVFIASVVSFAGVGAFLALRVPAMMRDLSATIGSAVAPISMRV